MALINYYLFFEKDIPKSSESETTVLSLELNLELELEALTLG
jgi:hypothetical protein